jgi:hypothetical protein
LGNQALGYDACRDFSGLRSRQTGAAGQGQGKANFEVSAGCAVVTSVMIGAKRIDQLELRRSGGAASPKRGANDALPVPEPRDR